MGSTEEDIEESPELEEYFAELRGAGDTDSQGQFTIDLSAARHKMRDRLLEKPLEYVLCLVRSAVAASATRMTVKVSRSGLVIEHNGTAATGDQLKQIFDYQLVPDQSADLALKELATGINTALSLEPERVLVDSWCGSQGSVLNLTDQSSRIESLPEDSKPEFMTTRVTILKRPSKELKLVKERCSFCPIPIWSGRSLLERGRFGDTRAMEILRFYLSSPIIKVSTGRPWYKLLLNPEPTASRHHHSVEVRRGGCESPWSLHLQKTRASQLVAAGESLTTGSELSDAGDDFEAVVGFETGLAKQVLRFVYLGVSIGEFSVDLGLPGFSGVVTARDLARDLSGANLAQDANFQKRVEQMGELGRMALEEVRARYGLPETLSYPHIVGRALIL